MVAGLSEAGKKAFVLAANFQRRNLSPEQKAELRQTQIAVAKEMKAEGDTQDLIAIRLGVNQSTVARWLTPNMQPHNMRDDLRLKLSSDDERVIHDRVQAGESQAQVAADYGISQQHASRVVKHEAKRRTRERDLESNAPISQMARSISRRVHSM